MTFKKLAALLAALILSLTVLASGALAVVEPTEDFYVADYANVLSPETEELIINYNGALEYQCDGAQVVVVTVDYLDGMYSDEYAVTLFNEWGIGSSKNNNGVLLLLAVEENKFWLTQGAGLSSALTNSDVNDLLDNYLAPDFDAKRYDEAVKSTFMQLLYWFDDYYSANVVASNPEYQQQYPQQQASGGVSLLSGAVYMIVIIVIISSFTSRGRYHRGGGGGFFFPFWLGTMFGRGSRRPPHDRWDDHDHWGGFGGGSGRGGGGFGGFGGFGAGGGFGGGGFSGGGGGGRR